MEGAERKVRGKERPRPWAPHLTSNAVALLRQKKGIRMCVFQRHRQHPNTVKKGETRDALCAHRQGSARRAAARGRGGFEGRGGGQSGVGRTGDLFLPAAAMPHHHRVSPSLRTSA